MVENANKGDENDDAAMAELTAMLVSTGLKRSPISDVARLFERGNRMSDILELVAGIIPPQVDPDQWLGWLEGGLPPAPRWVLQDPDAGRSPAARGAWQSAVRAREKAEARRDKLTSDLAQANDAVELARQEEGDVEARLRVTVLFRLLVDLSEQTAGAFAMGPAWTIMRAISGHTQSDPVYESTLDEGTAQRVERRKLDGPKMAARTRELLDLYCGDEKLELNLQQAIWRACEEHHAPIQAERDGRYQGGAKLSAKAKRPRRNSAQQQSSVRPGAPISDREDVLDGHMDSRPVTGGTEGEQPLDSDGA